MSAIFSEDAVRTLILGAAGRDFHNFNVVYRNDNRSKIIAFTATQIPGISGRRYPSNLSGPLYPDGISILNEEDFENICRAEAIERVVFAYSDVTHPTVMHMASRALAVGANFELLGPSQTMLTAPLPVIAISSVRTGCGKSQLGRWLSKRLRDNGLKVGVLRHPMPYGDLQKQRVQRFASVDDLSEAECTIEEREEYEPHIEAGGVIFAGVDYADITKAAEKESQILLWEGGNNDLPFLKPDLHIVLVDALRPDQLTTHHPGEAVLRMADVVVIAKSNRASSETISEMKHAIHEIVGEIPIVLGESPVRLEDPTNVIGRSVLIVEDGPTITHGGMPSGAGMAAVSALIDVDIVDPRASATDSIRAVYQKHPHIGRVLPAMGYSAEQRDELAKTINNSRADVVVGATPSDLGKVLALDKPIVRARYDYAERGATTVAEIVESFLTRKGL